MRTLRRVKRGTRPLLLELRRACQYGFTPAEMDEMAAIKKSDCPTGEGIIDWQTVCDVAKENGAKVFIIEREYDYKGDDIFCCVAEDLAYVRTIRE